MKLRIFARPLARRGRCAPTRCVAAKRAALSIFVAVACLAAAQPANATFPGRNGLMARGEYDGVHTAKVGGAGDVLVSPTAFASGTAWSADGRRIAFAASPAGDGKAHIYVADLASGRTTQVTTGVSDHSPSWSRDGKWIVFVRDGGIAPGEDVVYRVRSTGGAVHEIASGLYISAAELGPGGHTVAFVDDGDIYLVGLGGRHLRRIVDFPGGDRETLALQTSWAPHAGRLAILTALNSPCEHCDQLWTLRRDGTRLKPITPDPADDHPAVTHSSPVWAPNGRSLAFCDRTWDWTENPLSDQWLVNPNGSRARLVGHECGTSWQPLPPRPTTS